MFENDPGAPIGAATAPAKKPKAPGAPFAPAGDPSTQDVTTTTTPTFPGIPGVLGGDPNYQALLAFDTGASGQDLATMHANIAKMRAYYGSDTDPLTILGRIYSGYQDQNRTIANTLGGHGMIDSGETGFQGARATLAYQRAEYDAQFKLQQYIDGLNQAFAQAQQQRKFNELQASFQSVRDYLAANQPTSVTAPVTTYPDPGGTQSFQDWYATARRKGDEL